MSEELDPKASDQVHPKKDQPTEQNTDMAGADKAPEPNEKTENATVDSPTTVAKNIVEKCTTDIKTEIHKVIVGMDDAIEQALAAMFVDGHVLFEGFPGVAKTMMVKLIAKSINVDFKRIQFTPDLMPSDVIGTNIFDQSKATFTYRKGPIFSNLVLIDEINRAPAKTQSALFEAMEERQVTIEGNSYDLNFPFLVIATQNPIDQEGTYRLPEAQLDRFLFRIKVPYPTPEQEQEILSRFKNDFNQSQVNTVKSVVNSDKLKECQKLIEAVHIEPSILEYITSIAQATRETDSIYLGASPRASMAIMKASKVFAAMDGRNYVKPDDVQKACIPVLNHRLMIGATAEMEGYTSEDIIKSIIEDIEVPR